MTNIFSSILGLLWTLGTISRFYNDFDRIPISSDLFILCKWCLVFLIAYVHFFKKVSMHKLILIGVWLMTVGWWIKRDLNLLVYCNDLSIYNSKDYTQKYFLLPAQTLILASQLSKLMEWCLTLLQMVFLNIFLLVFVTFFLLDLIGP